MILKGTKIILHDDNVERAIRKFKKAVQESGLLQELRDRQHYTKPTTRRKLAQNLAKSRWRRYLKTQQLPKSQY